MMEHYYDGTTLGIPTYVRLIINLHAYVPTISTYFKSRIK